MSSLPHAPKRRQYAAGETQVYYGSAEAQYPADTPDIHQPADTGTSLTPQHVDLMTYPPDPRDLYAPPPEIRLPSGLSVLIDPTETRTALSYQSSTLNAVPRTQSLLSNSKLPLGLVISPHRTLADGEEAVPVVQDGLISRCQRCKAYMNPYVQFLDGDSRWRCSLCGLSNNDTPRTLEWSRRDEKPRYTRVELNHSVVDFLATPEYARGAPQAPAYVFLLDVSQGAINSGMFHTAIRTIAENLDNIPNEQLRIKVAIICYDVSLYFFSMPPGDGFEMLVVSDLEEAYLPRPDDLLVNLSEFRRSVEALLSRLPTIFGDSPHPSGGATGPALYGALTLLAGKGGKIVLLSASVSALGEGALDMTKNAHWHDTQKEPDSDKSASAFYHAFVLSCIKSCVSVDMFLAGDRYRGVATLTLAPHYTSGQVFYYPGFNAAVHEDAVKFAVELGRLIAMPVMLESEMRVRCSWGLSVKSMHGNFFVQASDRVVMPAVPLDQSYAVEFQFEETLTEPVVIFQTALLHTTSSGERRIRVINLALPTTSLVSEVFASADALAITTLLAKQTVQRSSVLSLEDRREKLFRRVADVCTAYIATSQTQMRASELQLLLPANLKMLPILVLGVFKKIVIHLNTEMALHDVRAYARVVLASAATQDLIRYIYPNIYSLHNMPADVGFVGSEGALVMPTPLPLTSTWWEAHGLYLIDDGQIIYLVVARDAVPRLINDVFGVEDYRALQGGKIDLPEVDTAISQRIRSIIGKIRERKGCVHYPSVCVVKDDASFGSPDIRSAAAQTLIHDRVDGLRLGYRQFLVKIYGK